MSSIASQQGVQGSGRLYRVMLVDDSAVVRGIFRRTLEVDPEIRIVATAGNGQQAIDALGRESVDVVVLDIEMPVMDGMTALPKLLEIDPAVKVIIASTLTQANADISLRALAEGAADYIPKPVARHAIHSAESFKRELVDKVEALGHARQVRSAPGSSPSRGALGRSTATTEAKAGPQETGPIARRFTLRTPSAVAPRVVCIGSSTGGPQALMEVLKELKGDFNLPILITQHMPKAFTAILAEHLKKAANRPSAEGVDGEPIEQGHIYVAPGGLHMAVATNNGRPVIRLDDGPPESFCKPAVDPMLRSAAEVYGNHLLTVILTGMGHDGLAGGKVVVEAGGTLIAQDEASSVVWGMPGAVTNAGLCSAVVPLSDVALSINRLARKSVA